METNICYILAAIFALSSVESASIFKIFQINGNYNTPIDLNVSLAGEYQILYPVSNTNNPYRVKAWSQNAGEDLPVLLVVRQAKFVTSWQVPMAIESSQKQTLLFRNTSKTMCHDNMDNILSNSKKGIITTRPIIISQSFILSVSTASAKMLDVHIELEEEKNFYVMPNRNYSLEISPSQPRYVFFRFANDSSDTVIIEVDSADNVCLTVSVQDNKCPVLDSNKDIKYEGTYQTINRKGATTIKKTDFELGFFLIFVARPDNYDCSQENSVIPKLRKKKITTINQSIVTFKVRNSIGKNDYIAASLGTLLALGVFGIAFTVISIAFNRCGTISKMKTGGSNRVAASVEPLSKDEISKMLQSENLTIDVLAKHPKRIKKKSLNYLAHTFSIALFYGIPVVQLVVTYQRMVNQTGDQDLCYYNFECAHPALGLSDFNHIFSNMGYIIIGIFFMFTVIHRQTRVKLPEDKGIPVHYGLFHAMGVALIIEGILSACYHVCPSQSNYQFDTSFMYIMAVLMMVKLYQNRHPDINASAYSTFTVVGLTIFMAMVGILDGGIVIWTLFMVCYAILVVLLSFRIYFFNNVVNGLRQLKTEVEDVGLGAKAFLPIRKSQFLVLLLVNILNYGMLVGGIILYVNQMSDFGTFILGLLMGNTITYCVFYTVMKLVNHERICLEAILYGLLGIACWVSSCVFFVDAATEWTVTPAESRQWNQDCILLNFYDKHDVWHLLSAPALYFTFMYLMHLDDDVVCKDRSQIAVF